MKPIRYILAVVLPKQDPKSTRRFVGNAIALAEWANADIHVLAASPEREEVEREIAERDRSALAGRVLVMHPVSGTLAGQMQETIGHYDCDLILISSQGFVSQAETANLGKILEAAPRPVLVLPDLIDLGKNPLRSFLVPLSGEKRVSEALRYALALAEGKENAVDIVHVVDAGARCSCSEALETLGDEFQHEYAIRSEKIVAQASPFSSARQRKLVRRFYNVSGNPSDGIPRLARQIAGSVLVVEWKGTLVAGHADVVKTLVLTLDQPILFVKERGDARSTLKVGRDFEVA